VSLQTEETANKEMMEDEHEEEHEEDTEEEEELDGSSQSTGSHQMSLLVYRIMYYPTFDLYVFPPQTSSTLNIAMSRQTLSDQVNTALQAR